MSKSVLVIDTPKTCRECILCVGRMNHFRKEYKHFCNQVFDTGNGDCVQHFVDPDGTIPDWCPFSSLPNPINLCQYTDNIALNMDSILAYQYAQGYNDFRDEILKGETE